MATTTAKTHPTEMPALAQQIREQLVSTVKQGQQMSVDAAQTWVKAVSVLPAPRPARVPGIPAVPDVEEATKYAFDVAADLLVAQRDFALQLASVFSPRRSLSDRRPRQGDDTRTEASMTAAAMIPSSTWEASSARSDRWPICRCASCLRWPRSRTPTSASSSAGCTSRPYACSSRSPMR